MNRFLFALFFTLCSQAFAAVWSHPPDRVWDEEWENKYSAWFQATVDESWLMKKDHIFSGWQVDCAEFPYLVRLYFSYTNGLEFAIRDSSQSGQKVSSLGKAYDSISDPAKRVQAFAKNILSRVSTRTLPQDTVLLAVNKKTIRPGVILAGDRQRAHTFVVKEVRASGVPIFVYGTLPASEYLYVSYGFPAVTSYFPSGKLPSDEGGGLRQFRWPQELFKPASEISRRAIDQTTAGKMKYETFFDEVHDLLRVAPRNENDEMSYLMDDLCAKVRERVNVIIDAGQALAKTGGRFTSAQEDLYSTPKRDRDILSVIQMIDQKYKRLGSSLSPGNQKRYGSLISPRWKSDDECLIPWAENRLEPIGAIRARFLEGRMSSSPYDSFSKRWGE